MIYLDHNATTPLDPLVREAMLPFLGACFGNPSSVHDTGARALDAVDVARERVAAFLGCRPAEVCFTSGGTEADNLAVLGVARARPSRRRIVTTAVEHPAVLGPCESLEGQGWDVVRIGVDGQGRLDLDALRESLTEGTALLTLMLANNETGVLLPVREAARAAREKDVIVHVDAVQAAGKVDLAVGREGFADLLSISGHKIGGPKGAGALFVRRGISLEPLVFGGGQERGRRPGTENVPGIVGLGRACEIAGKRGASPWEAVARRRDRLEEGLLRAIPGSHAVGREAPRVANTTNLVFEGVEGEAVLLLLSEEGIAASSGSACSSGSLEPSHVLLAMGLDESRARGSLRLSLGLTTTDEEIDRVLGILPGIVRRLRAMAPEEAGEGPPGRRDRTGRRGNSAREGTV